MPTFIREKRSSDVLQCPSTLLGVFEYLQFDSPLKVIWLIIYGWWLLLTKDRGVVLADLWYYFHPMGDVFCNGNL